MPTSEERTKPVHVRMTPEEHAIVVSNAKKAGESLSQYMRRKGLEGDPDVDPTKDRVSELEDLVTDLVRRMETLENMANGTSVY